VSVVAAEPAPAARVSAVVLAAGSSERFGAATPKQLATFQDETLVRRAARVALASAACEVLVVTGYRAAEVERAFDGLAVRVVRNSHYARGQSTSVRAGLAAVDPRSAGALFVPCDQPLLDAATLDRLIQRFAALPPEQGGAWAVVPSHRGRRGSPALIGRGLFADLERLAGDEGGRRVMAARPDRVVEVELDDPAPLVDVDTLADLRRLEASDR
jgi:molybdenum cofactor cytidylyltransferase